MQINIQGHNVELTQPLKEYAIKKIGKLQDYYNNIQKIEIILDVRPIDDFKRSQVAEVSAWLAGKKVIRATEAGENMYAAIDLVYDELKRQVIKHKDRHIKEKRRLSEKIKEISRKAINFIIPRPNQETIARRKMFDIKNMTSEEALNEKNSLGHEFFVFRNAETGELNVLHKEKTINPDEVQSLSEVEAVSELKKKNMNFLPFINPDTNEINVLYKKKSGNLGLIEPAI